MSESQDELTPARQGQLLDAAVEGMAWALIEDETDTVDRGVSPEHYRDAVQRAKALLPMLVADPASEPTMRAGLLATALCLALAACQSAGISGIAAFAATWFRPQRKQQRTTMTILLPSSPARLP